MEGAAAAEAAEAKQNGARQGQHRPLTVHLKVGSSGVVRLMPTLTYGVDKDKDAHMMHQHDRALFLLMHLVASSWIASLVGRID